MADDKKAAPAAETKKAEVPKGPHTHIRFIGHPSEDEHSATEVFGKRFHRGKWVPLANLDGTNSEKRALPKDQLTKLIGNPAFQLGHGEDAPVPGVGIGDEQPAEEA